LFSKNKQRDNDYMAVFQYSLPELKIYNIFNMQYRFSGEYRNAVYIYMATVNRI